MASIPAVGIAEFAVRLFARPAQNDWAVLTAPPDRIVDAAESLLVELNALGQRNVSLVLRPSDAADLLRQLWQTHSELTICTGLEGFEEADWRVLDGYRSRLQGLPTMALLVSHRQLQLITFAAPHLASWLTSSLFSLDDGFEYLSPEERETRLRQLREASGLSDDEVIARATHRTLPPEPTFTEWLILLGRSDLLVD